ncbi:glutaredoxin family protein [Shewanella sp. ENK2]|uniref:glutaredoxin family protein n=1 Tax=Shewanella sp. ENK2 TaxID=2775245 RepID=UPI0037483B1A
MKKLFVLLVLYAAYQHWNQSPVEPIRATYAASNEVIMYATAWCKYCQKARIFFDDNGIAYQEFDIEKSFGANERYQALNGQGIPLLQVNGTLIRGFNQDKIVSSLH